MTTMMKLLAAGAGVAGIAAAAPASAQYYAYPNAYVNPYASAYVNPYANATAIATSQCTAAVQARLNNRVGIQNILGAVLGVNSPTGRVVSITRVNPNRSTIRVRGLATSGRMAGYGPYGVGAYGALGYAYAPDLSFKCDVDYRGFVRDVDINRR